MANGYGARDAGFIAHQCSQAGMHITTEDIIVEIVDSEGQVLPTGEAGEIVITHLATVDFPFIRYRIGDVGVLCKDTCPCGRGLPLLQEIQGRTTHFVIASNGIVLHGLVLIYVLRDLPGIENFKVVQHSLARTEVQVVSNSVFQKSDSDLIMQEFKKRLGEEVGIEIKLLASIDRERSGKFRYVISHVPLA